ncbi:hypothetical protein ACWDBF_17055 [Streptomyces angustmyceticus]
MESDLAPVRESFFLDEDREAAVRAGIALVNAFRRIGVDLEDIKLHPPCEGCNVNEYTFTLGRVRVEETREMALTINHRLSVLESAGRRRNAEHPKATEAAEGQ